MKKICKNCKIFYEGVNCPLCKGNETAVGWQGRVNILDANKSEIAKKIGIKVKGEYALKVR